MDPTALGIAFLAVGTVMLALSGKKSRGSVLEALVEIERWVPYLGRLDWLKWPGAAAVGVGFAVVAWRLIA